MPDSAAGPDGIPFLVYKQLKNILKPIVHDIVLGMIAGTECPDADFNKAFLICLPKTTDEELEPSGTRPLSIVDSINRIIASVFRIVLELSLIHI
eukprot:5499743-Karenia_brevis.AAC.1